MYNISIKEGGHKWEKQNALTITTSRGSYDLMKCSLCGISGKTSSINTIQLKGSYARETVFNCKGNKTISVLKKIKITHCTAQGKIFENIIDGSIHEVVTPPKNYKNDHTGVWVMGNGEPVKILTEEFDKL